jgi:hypothetical protein
MLCRLFAPRQAIRALLLAFDRRPAPFACSVRFCHPPGRVQEYGPGDDGAFYAAAEKAALNETEHHLKSDLV